MSHTTVFPTDPAIAEPIYAQAAADAIERVNKHWADWNFNMWETYNSVLNNTWVDPWFEHENGGIYNGPSTGPNDPAYEMTQNLYMIYCWLRYKGYHDYALVALTTGTIQSSTMTGGLWQACSTGPQQGAVKPYGSLIGFDATSTNSNANRGDWHFSSVLATWTAEQEDEYLGTMVYLTADPGSWDAVRKYPIAKTAESIGGHIYIRPDYNNGVHFNRNAAGEGYGRDTTGYGFVQWTNYTKLVQKARLAATDGEKHWQLNLTLQLMIMEWERVQAMTVQDEPGYLGEWVDGLARNAFIEKDGSIYTYGYSCTWDDWRDDKPLRIFLDKYPNVTFSNWDKIHIMMDIFRCCYLQTGYADFNFQQKSTYVWNAIQYWENGIGWNPIYIPRARDIPECELDYLHVDPELFIITAGRRKTNNGRRTVLL